jgi:hypothetical protein
VVSLNERAKALFSHPLEYEAIVELLASAPGGAIEPAPLRAVKALEVGFQGVVAQLQTLVGQEVSLGYPPHQDSSGKLLQVHPTFLKMEISGGVTDFPMNRVSPRAILGHLGPGPESLDRYLFRAALHLAAGQESEAWFDFHGALILSGEDGAARNWAQQGIEQLASKSRSEK